jgi:hypothetical protein
LVFLLIYDFGEYAFYQCIRFSCTGYSRKSERKRKFVQIGAGEINDWKIQRGIDLFA